MILTWRTIPNTIFHSNDGIPTVTSQRSQSQRSWEPRTLLPADLEGLDAIPLLACWAPAHPLHVLRSAHFAHVHLSNHTTIRWYKPRHQPYHHKDKDTDTDRHAIIQIIQTMCTIIQIIHTIIQIIGWYHHRSKGTDNRQSHNHTMITRTWIRITISTSIK